MSTHNIVELEETEEETYEAKIIVPEGKEKIIDESNIRIDDFRQRSFCVSVDWGVVLKVLFASIFLGGTFKRKQIADLTDLGTTTISNAVRVIKEDFDNVYYKKIIKKPYGIYENKGINLEVPAFDFRRKEPEKSCSFRKDRKKKNKLFSV